MAVLPRTGLRAATVPHGGTSIGPNTFVRGHLTGDESLAIAGRLEGRVTLDAPLVVEAGATVQADLVATEITVHGVVVGSLTAAGLVILREGARVVGDIQAGRLVLDEGAQFRGQVQMSGTAPRSVAPRVAVSRPVASRPAASRVEARVRPRSGADAASRSTALPSSLVAPPQAPRLEHDETSVEEADEATGRPVEAETVVVEHAAFDAAPRGPAAAARGTVPATTREAIGSALARRGAQAGVSATAPTAESRVGPKVRLPARGRRAVVRR